MTCMLCLSDSNQMLDIFDQNGCNLNISNIISKHFWMKPNARDYKANSICSPCWNTVEIFHKFYQKIEIAHANLTYCLKLPMEETFPESNQLEPFSDLFTVVKLEDFVDIKVEVLQTAETALFPPIESVPTQNFDVQKALTCGSESEVILTNDHNANESTNGNEYANSAQDLDEQSQKSESSESDSDYNAPKKKAKVKASSATSDGSGKKMIPCKEFDNFIKKNMQLVCDICSKSLENFANLKDHFKKAHKKNGYVSCCDRSFTSRFSLVHHLILHQDPDMFKCKRCDRVLANKKSFINHMTSHKNQELIHKCTRCDKSFSSIPKLEKHSKTHNRLQSDQICEQCGKVCHNKRSLAAHQKREHLGFVKQRLQCQICGAYLADPSTLHTHMKYLHPKTDMQNVCKICGKVSSTGYGLKRHIQYMHIMERVHKCHICENKAFKTAQNLRVS